MMIYNISRNLRPLCRDPVDQSINYTVIKRLKGENYKRDYDQFFPPSSPLSTP